MDKFSIFLFTGVMKCQSKTHFAFIQKGKRRNRRGKTILRGKTKLKTHDAQF